MLFKLVVVLSCVLCACAIDKTLEPETFGEDVVCEVIKKIDDSAIFSEDKKLLRRIAYVESMFGADELTYREGYHGGIWAVNNDSYNDVINNPSLDKLWPKFEKLLTKEKKDIKWEDLRMPLFSGVFARIRLHLIADKISWDLFEQAKYWNKNYNLELGNEKDFVIRVDKMEKEFGPDCDVCKEPTMNLEMIMDGSKKIGQQDFDRALKIAGKLIDTFSTDTVDIGFILFSDKVQEIFSLKSSLTRDEMKEKILTSTYPNQSAKTELAIDAGVKMFEKADNSAGALKVQVLFTNGVPDNANPTMSAADKAKKSNITIFTVGIGSEIKYDVLEKIASQESYVIPVSSYEVLTQLFNKIDSKTCGEIMTPDIGTPVKDDQLRKKEKRYFKFEVPNDGITIKIENTIGNTQGFYSYTNENPSAVINDDKFTNKVFIAAKPPSARWRRDTEQATSVYVTIQGMEDKDVYTLNPIKGNPSNGGIQLKTSVFVIMTSIMMMFYTLH